ncbi:hypothetical protein O181_109168 [Austropuccinia psidii MF-1]|uniref:Uncharacterized protein n=1 Tax=Austropuccinia psidii MF-1 TaxID=1389203 RepID=A0A9Q3JU83_9BASI|nr:hypothetical protein [Austropuccinia psidii MF-1]
MITRVFTYGLELKDSDGSPDYWCILLPAFELAYKTSIHASTGKTPAMLEKSWNPTKFPVYNLEKDSVNIYPTASSFKSILDKVRHHESQSMTDELEYAKQKWDIIHKNLEFKVGDLILASSFTFDNI